MMMKTVSQGKERRRGRKWRTSFLFLCAVSFSFSPSYFFFFIFFFFLFSFLMNFKKTFSSPKCQTLDKVFKFHSKSAESRRETKTRRKKSKKHEGTQKKNKPGRANRCVRNGSVFIHNVFPNGYVHRVGQTDRPSYRDARTHLKRIEKLASCQKICDAVDHHQRPTMCWDLM